MKNPDPFSVILDDRWRDTEFRVDDLREVISQARPGDRYIRFILPEFIRPTLYEVPSPAETTVSYVTLAREKTRVFVSEREVWRFPTPEDLARVRAYMAEWRKYHGD